MSEERKWKPAPGTVLGVIAIVIAFGGSAYAIKLGRNSVKSKQIAPNAVKSSDIGPDQAKGVDVQESSLAQVPNAANAATAANAGQVDGHDAVCPAGTFLQNGVCFDTNVRFAMINYISATQLCADAGGHLPAISELQSIRSLVNLGAAGNGHWADVVYDDGGAFEAMTVSQAAGTIEAVAVAGFRQARCAFKLVR